MLMDQYFLQSLEAKRYFHHSDLVRVQKAALQQLQKSKLIPKA